MDTAGQKRGVLIAAYLLRMDATLNETGNRLGSVEDIEEFLTTKGDAAVINIWNNLQESFDNEPERIQWFNKIAAKRGCFA